MMIASSDFSTSKASLAGGASAAGADSAVSTFFPRLAVLVFFVAVFRRVAFWRRFGLAGGDAASSSNGALITSAGVLPPLTAAFLRVVFLVLRVVVFFCFTNVNPF